MSLITGGTALRCSSLEPINILSPSTMIQRRERLKIYRRQRLKKNKKPPSHSYFQAFSFNPQALELPEDLIFSEILTRLPVKSLTRFKSVSYEWKSIISSPKFIKSHLEQSNSNPYVPSNCVFIKSPYCFNILNYAAYDRYPDDNHGEKGLISVKSLKFDDHSISTFLIGSCNGLICFGRKFEDYYFFVYNPVLGTYDRVVDPLGNFQCKLMTGFGFVSSKDDFLLFVGGLQRRCLQNFVYVYSLRLKKWRKIGAFDESEIMILCGGQGILVNETLHWDKTQVRKSSAKNFICGFDLSTETFKDMPLPKALVGDGKFSGNPKLCELGGSLCSWSVEINGGIEMWMLKQYGRWDSWMKLFKFDMVPGLVNFYGLIGNGKVLVQTKEGSLLLADPNQYPSSYTSVARDLGSIEIVSYVRSLVSPFF